MTSPKLLLLLFALFVLAACSTNRIEISAEKFSSTNDAGLRNCPLGQIDSLAACRVAVTRSHTDLAWLANNGSVQANGDTLTFAVNAPTAKEVRVSGGVELPLTRVGNSSIFAGSLHVPFLDYAVISYRIFTDTTQALPLRFEFRGDETGVRPARARKLRGNIRADTLFSPSLNEHREVITYVPPASATNGKYDIVYMPDGGLVKQLALLIDTMIVTGKMKPVALVGVRASPQMRSHEYVFGFNNDTTRFIAHEQFFIRDVMAWAEKTLPVATDRDHRFIWGASNGGAFAVAMGLRHPELFSRVFASSPVFELVPASAEANLPRFYLAAGTFEGTSRDRALGLTRALADRNALAEFTELVGGHDEVLWIEWLARALVNWRS